MYSTQNINVTKGLKQSQAFRKCFRKCAMKVSEKEVKEHLVLHLEPEDLTQQLPQSLLKRNKGEELLETGWE